jgi:8-oxo-dGTP pyrophosphatase MutT (NUDIX family)
VHDGELWQVFAENGQPVAGTGAIDDDFAHDDSLVMGNAHVWMWRKTDKGADVLLQKRALTKKTSPGYYHISAAGHINVGESPIEAALRETKEELGVAIDPSRLYLVHVTRSHRHLQSLLYVYIYLLSGDETFSYDDGEVELTEWHSVDHFYDMTKNAEVYKLIDQGRPYFDPLIAAIKRHAI